MWALRPGPRCVCVVPVGVSVGLLSTGALGQGQDLGLRFSPTEPTDQTRVHLSCWDLFALDVEQRRGEGC